jgi:hypothetical protein
MRRIVVILGLITQAERALAQAPPSPVPVTANVPRSIVVQLGRPAVGQPRLECQSTSPVIGTTVSYERATVDGQALHFDNVVVQWLNTASATKIQIPCQATDSAGSAQLTLDLEPARASDAKVTLVPGGARAGTSVIPQVRVQIPVGARILPLAKLPVSVQLPGEAGFTANVSTDEEGIATFPLSIQKAKRDAADTVAFIRLGTDRVASLPFAVNPAPLDSVRLPQQPVRAVVGRAFNIPIPGFGANTNVCDRDAVTIVRADGVGRLLQHGKPGPSYTAACTTNLMMIDDLLYEGPVQDLTLEVTVKGVTKTLRVTTEPGAAAVLRFTQQPPTFLVANADTNMAPAPKLRLEDRFGNPIANHTVTATLLCDRVVCPDAFFGGTSIVTTNAEGIADFTGIRFVGLEREYTLCFLDVTSVSDRVCSDPATAPRLPFISAATGSIPSVAWKASYDVDREYNKSFVIISAIHSVSGVQPTNEFFDVRFRFRLPAGFSAHVSADLNIERASTLEKDTVKGGREVTEAVGMINWSGSRRKIKYWHNAMRVTDERTDALDRLLFVGGQVRVFSGVPYAGLHIGNVEMGHSAFFGSSFTLGYLTPLSYLPVKLADNPAVYPTQHNLIAEAFLRSSQVNFFEFLNVRGTFLLPFETARRVQSRIAIAVPIGGIKAF